MKHFYKKSILFNFLFVLFLLAQSSATALAQEKKTVLDSISGTVTDNNGKPLKKVKVTNKENKATFITTEKGTFSLPGNKGDHISIWHSGFYDYEIVWKGQRNLTVQLAKRFLSIPYTDAIAKDTALIETSDAYVDILHGQQLKSNLLQSIATVNTNQLTTTPASQFLQALPGRLPGLNISSNSGMPGLDGTGISSSVRQARGNQIILIDGVQRGFLSIDPDQIESVSVLKDALSTIMYGQRSSNGIISIVTKKGDVGQPRISFSAQTAIQQPRALPKPLQAWQYATLYNEAKQNDAPIGVTLDPVYSAAAIAAYRDGTNPFLYPNVDWYNTILNDHSKLQRYNFNAQGSGNGFRYFIDVDNLKETGLFKTIDSNVYNTNAQLDRYIVRTNLGVDVTKTTQMQLNLFGRIQKNNQPGGETGGILGALFNTPQNAYPVRNPNGSLGAASPNYAQNANIYGQEVYRGYKFQDARDMAVDLQVTQKLDVLLPGLYLKAQGSYNNSTLYTTTRTKDFEAYQYLANGTYSKISNVSAQISSGAANDRTRVTYVEADLGYSHSFGKHNVQALVLADQQSTLPYLTGNLPENYSDYAARLNYNYDNTYLIEAAGSYAGYNYFAPAKRWAPFWAGGIGWNAHHEHFIKDNFKWISNLKLRATYGITGQANAGYYSYIQTYWTPETNTSNGDGAYFGNGGSLVRSTGQNTLVNPELGPEKAKKMNIGIDLGLFDNQLTYTADYFKNRYFDVVGAPGLTTQVLGTGFPSKNLQKFDYWGTDMSLTWQSRVRNFNYFFTGNFSMIQSKVVFNDELPKAYDYQKGTGHQVSLQYGYIATGLFQSYAEINDPKTAIYGKSRDALRPGDIRYLDRNGDGVIDDKDNGIIGSGKPVVYYGGTFGFSFNGLDLSFLIQGTLNRQTYISGDFMNGFGNSGINNAYEYNLGRWTAATAATASQPRVWLGSNVNNQLTSSFWLKNTDFIRLKNVEIGYTLPGKVTRKIGVPSIRFFVNGLNLLTWSEIYKVRKDLDPEAMGAAYPIMRVFNSGINVKF